jgi:chemotaxis protein MotB
VGSLEAELSATEAERLAEAAAAEALRNRLQNADAELTAMTLALEEQRQAAEDTLTLLAAAESAKTQLDARLAEVLNALDAAKATARDRDELADRLTRVLAQMDVSEAAANDRIAALEAKLSDLQQQRDQAQSALDTVTDDKADTEEKLLAALEQLELANAAAADRDVLQQRLLAALSDGEDASAKASDLASLAEQRAALLAQARESLSQEQEISQEAQRQTALLNQQVAALREQLGSLQALLDDYKARDVAQQVQMQNLGQDLNAALARAAAEERRRRILEEEERKRLEAEAAQLSDKAQDLEQYRSEFFGRLRDVLGNQEGVRIEGDRFVFASEVLFAPGSADLSPEGRAEIAKVARILQTVAAAIPQGINWIIRVDGHTDDTPLGAHPKFADNWELSQGRALSVVRYMVQALGIPPERLSANGFGEYQPVNPAETPEARAQNRRIELKFTER